MLRRSKLHRLYSVMPHNWRRRIFLACLFLVEKTPLGSITYGFEAEVMGTRFRLQGPFRYTGVDYYGPYRVQGAYEPSVTAHITEVVRQCHSPRVLDVGSHYGWYTIYLAKLIGDRGIVYSFEPSEAIFSILERNIELNSLNNVLLYKLPLSDKRETISMVTSNRYPQEPRSMSVIEQGAAKNRPGVLSATPFDELNEAEAIHPNIVKIDVRGVWRKVVDGMRESLRKDVEHLYLELDTPTWDLAIYYEDIRHVIALLRDAGMNVYEITNFRKRDGSEIVKADEESIAYRGEVDAMLYAVKIKP